MRGARPGLASSLPVRDAPTLLMRDTPDRAYTDVPGALLELAHLPDVYPAPVLAHFNLVPWSYLDPLAIDLQHGLLSWAEDPVANMFPPARPQADPHGLLPIIGDGEFPTRPPAGRAPARFAPVILREDHHWCDQQYDGKYTPPSHPLRMHGHSSFCL